MRLGVTAKVIDENLNKLAKLRSKIREPGKLCVEWQLYVDHGSYIVLVCESVQDLLLVQLRECPNSLSLNQMK